MKIRNGFVSNSSSSSFLVVAKRINTVEELRNAKNPFLYGWDSYGDAPPFIELNKEKVEYLINNLYIPINRNNNIGMLLDVAETHEEEVELKKLKEILPEFDDFIVTVIECEYHSPDEMEEFKAYLGEEA